MDMTKKAKKLSLIKVNPLTDRQSDILFDLDQNRDVAILGYAGTGKSFLGVYRGLKGLMEKKYERFVIIRSAVPSRGVGFLKGSLEEKMEVYELPYRSIVNELMRNNEAYDNLKSQGKIQFESTSYLRGMTFDNCVILVDEIQNMSEAELNTVMTRQGKNCQVILCGDHRQEDKEVTKVGRSCVPVLLKVLDVISSIRHYNMEEEDIVRSEKAKDWIIAYDRLSS